MFLGELSLGGTQFLMETTCLLLYGLLNLSIEVLADALLNLSTGRSKKPSEYSNRCTTKDSQAPNDAIQKVVKVLVLPVRLCRKNLSLPVECILIVLQDLRIVLWGAIRDLDPSVRSGSALRRPYSVCVRTDQAR